MEDVNREGFVDCPLRIIGRASCEKDNERKL
jgi:hypothetical protein